MLLKDFVKKIFFDSDFRISKITDSVDLIKFFKLIKPVTTEYNLIRLGGKNDGGYLVPDDLIGIKTCFSPGVNDIANFELDLINRGIKCFLADYSVDKPPVMNHRIDFKKKYLGQFNSDIYITLDKWINECDPYLEDGILQMDIEGNEYEILCNSSSEIIKKFRIIVIEFHNLDSILDKVGYRMIYSTFNKILNDFYLVHIHPNNCNLKICYKNFEIIPDMEFTFIRKDRVNQVAHTKSFPHILDQKNNPKNPEIVLPRCWYS